MYKEAFMKKHLKGNGNFQSLTVYGHGTFIQELSLQQPLCGTYYHPHFIDVETGWKKENKNSVSFSTLRLILSLTHSRCSVNGHWLERDILLIPVQGFSLKSVWLRHSCCSQYHMMREKGVLNYFFPILIINQWDINISIISVSKTCVYCYYFGKHPNIILKHASWFKTLQVPAWLDITLTWLDKHQCIK